MLSREIDKITVIMSDNTGMNSMLTTNLTIFTWRQTTSTAENIDKINEKLQSWPQIDTSAVHNKTAILAIIDRYRNAICQSTHMDRASIIGSIAYALHTYLSLLCESNGRSQYMRANHCLLIFVRRGSCVKRNRFTMQILRCLLNKSGHRRIWVIC